MGNNDSHKNNTNGGSGSALLDYRHKGIMIVDKNNTDGGSSSALLLIVARA